MIDDPMRSLAEAEGRDDWAEVAAIAEHELMDLPRAIAAWQRAIERDVSDLPAQHELARLYRVTARWSELADLLEHHRELVDNPEALRAVLGELIAIYRERLGDEARAAELARLADELG